MPHWATGLVTCLCFFTNFSSFLYSSSSSAVARLFPDPTSVDIKWHVSSWVWLSSSYLMLQMTGRFLQCLHSLCGYIVFQDDFLGDFILFLVTLFHWLNVFSIYLSTDGHAGYFQFLVICCTAINRSSVFFFFEILFPSGTQYQTRVWLLFLVFHHGCTNFHEQRIMVPFSLVCFNTCYLLFVCW